MRKLLLFSLVSTGVLAVDCQTKADCGKREYCGIHATAQGVGQCKPKNDNPTHALNYVHRTIGDRGSKTDVIKECRILNDRVIVTETKGRVKLKETTKAITPPIKTKELFDAIYTASEQDPKVTSVRTAQPPMDIIAGDHDDLFLIDWENGTDKIRLETYEAAWLRGLIYSRCPVQ
ncbi:hypothetical protein K2X33_07895 [bacterium]|nr:hypothetical protein [bacterium]